MNTAYALAPSSNEEWVSALRAELPGALFHPLTHAEQPRQLVAIICVPLPPAVRATAEDRLVAALRALLPRAQREPGP